MLQPVPVISRTQKAAYFNKRSAIKKIESMLWIEKQAASGLAEP
jgi:hypothetical protein